MDATQRHISATADESSHVSANPAYSRQSSHSREALNDIAFGSIAGIVGKYIEYPFDTVKVRLQSQPDNQALRYRGPLDCFRQSFQQDGIRGFYRGISAPLVGAALETSSLFFSYRLAQSALQATTYTDRPLTIPALVACGGASGAFTSILLTPIELVKCKMQVPHHSSGPSTGAPGVLDLIRSIHRHQGLSGFWHGQMGTLIRETGGSAAWFGSYEALSAAFRPFRPPATETEDTSTVALPIWQQMVAGAIAGMSYNLVFYPADTIKSRMQTEKLGLPGSRKETFLVVGKALWRQQGLAGFYRGCGITVARAAPSSAFIFTVYEALRAWFG